MKRVYELIRKSRTNNKHKKTAKIKKAVPKKGIVNRIEANQLFARAFGHSICFVLKKK